MKDRILVFGTGSVAEKFLTIVDLEKVEILAFINTKTEASRFHEFDIIGLDEIKKYRYDYVVIASGYTIPIRKLLKEANIRNDQIISYIFDDDEFFLSFAEEMNNILADRYNRDILKKWQKDVVILPRFAPAVFWDEQRALKTYYKDFVREQTVKLLYDVMKESGVNGAIAELGVFRGDFTVVLDDIFPDSTMYLFDTFQGFDEKDVSGDETIENKQGESEKFKDTSAELVITRLKHKDRVVVKQGYFPETFDLYDENFAFVSIDLNLIAPTKSALDLFWPRMTTGGYILVSCYYAPFYEGTRKAVNEWCKENGVVPIPVADFYGSVLLVKER